MSRKCSKTNTTPSAPSLPIPAPLNIATREYYRPSATVDANDADIDFPTSAPSSPKPQDENEQQGKNARDVRSEEVYDFIEISKTPVAPHSPSPSDIVLNSDLQDVAEMSALDRELRERGVERGEKKEKLLELQGMLVRERKRVAEEAERKRAEELEREYDEVQRRGREV